MVVIVCWSFERKVEKQENLMGKIFIFCVWENWVWWAEQVKVTKINPFFILLDIFINDFFHLFQVSIGEAEREVKLLLKFHEAWKKAYKNVFNFEVAHSLTVRDEVVLRNRDWVNYPLMTITMMMIRFKQRNIGWVTRDHQHHHVMIIMVSFHFLQLKIA